MSNDETFAMPEAWALVKLGDRLVSGVQPGFACGAHNRGGEGIAHLRPMNVTSEGRIDLSDIKFVPASEVDRDERLLAAGDVLFNNTNSPELVGKTAYYGDPTSRAFSNHMTRVRCCREILDPRFAALALHHKWQLGYFQSVCNNHVSQASISRSVLLDTEIPLPPLAEQRRIVAKVEALHARVQAARERLARVPLILKRFRQAILAAACNGQLTADWRDLHSDVEPSRALLSRMAEERQAIWQRRSSRRRYIEPEAVEREDLPELPNSWSWTNFDHCSWEITVGHVGPMRDRYVEQGIPFLRSQNVRPLRFDPRGLVFIADDFHAALKKSALDGGEILVTRSGANTGDCCVYPTSAGPANCADLVVTRPLSGLLPDYGAIYIASPDGQSRIGLKQTGMAQPHFNIGAMRIKPFPLPPEAEQHEIVRRVHALFKLADGIEHRVAAATARADKLAQAILAKAFRGELVPAEAELARAAGRDYETAEQLLDRIRRSQAPEPAAPASNGRPKAARRPRKKALRARD